MGMLNRNVKNYIMGTYYFEQSGIRPSQFSACQLDNMYKVTIGTKECSSKSPKNAFEIAFLKSRGYFVPDDVKGPRENRLYKSLQVTGGYRKALEEGLNPMIVQIYKGVVHVGHVFYFGTPSVAFRKAYGVYKNNCKEAYGI